MGLYSPPWRAIWPHFGSMGPYSPPGGLYGPKPPALGKKEGGKHFLTPGRATWPHFGDEVTGDFIFRME